MTSAADAFASFSPCYFRLKHATEKWEHSGARALRHTVFCNEQRIFAQSDRDDIDPDAIHLVALSTIAVANDEVVGTVRIHENASGLWYGSRLAVDRRYRRVGLLGPALIRLAVSSARSLGCIRFHAHVQVQNEPMFRRLNWNRLSEVDLHGRPHVLMQADLTVYPKLANATEGFHAFPQRAVA